MWLQKPPDYGPTLVPDYMRDTITRCLRDGWVEVPDPRAAVEPVASMPAEPEHEDERRAAGTPGDVVMPHARPQASEPSPAVPAPLAHSATPTHKPAAPKRATRR